MLAITMRFINPINLIPRNNWDYGFDALFSALGNLGRNTTKAPNTETIFRQIPIWTNTGRASLYAILKALDLPAGARVGVPLFCCSVVFNAILQAGLTPCFIDSNLEDCNISVEDLRRKRAELAALVVVHMFGKICDMDAILEVADPIPVIEDCAQALFSEDQGQLAGTISGISFFSFRCGKYISAGEGSAIFCKNLELHQKIKRVVASFDDWSAPQMLIHALSTFIKATLYNRPWYGLIGYPIGMKLDKKLNLTAKDGFETGKIASTHLALIEARIGSFREKIKIQHEHAQMLLNSIQSGNFVLPANDQSGAANWFQFPLKFPGTLQRDRMAGYLLSQGIDTSKYLDEIVDEARLRYGYRGGCPNAELLSKTVLLVPIHYTLRTRDIEHLARSINEGSQVI